MAVGSSVVQPLAGRYKAIIVCADDFGMHPYVDDAVLRLARLGRLNATSCMTLAPSFAQSAPALRDVPGMRIGLHLNFTEALSDQGLYLPLPALLARVYSRRLDMSQVRRQIDRQFDAFHDVLGMAPDFVDGHQHVHQLPQIRSALLAALQQRYGDAPPRDGVARAVSMAASGQPQSGAGAAVRPWLRSTVARRPWRQPPVLAAKALVIQALGAGALRRMAGTAGYSMNHALLGVYGFSGGMAQYGRLLRGWLSQVRAGDLLMCHPATAALPGDVLGQQRQAEYQVLETAQAAQWMQDAGVVLA